VVHFDQPSVNSHLRISKPISERQPTDISTIGMAIVGDSFRMRFTGYPNDEGFLGRIEAEVEAQSFNDARQRAHRALASILSAWSTKLDVPLHIYQITCTELTTGQKATVFLVPFSERKAPTGNLDRTTTEFRFYASLIREALCSNSPIYQFLCLYKVIEGVRRRRTRLGKEAKERKERFVPPAESIPPSEGECRLWLQELFSKIYDFQAGFFDLDTVIPPEIRGRKFKTITDHLNKLRHAIAHSLSSDPKELRLLADELLHIEEVERWLPLTRCIVRQMLKNEFPSEFSGEASG
jgi:hypothetical protein